MRGRRNEVHFHRRKSAWRLAAIVCGENHVTREEFDRALSLLDRIQRYAIADAREWEAENSSERYCNSKTHAHKEELLDARRARLQEELKPYGLHLVNYGLYPTVVDKNDHNQYMLHYFD
jgi:hypothetical protein